MTGAYQAGEVPAPAGASPTVVEMTSRQIAVRTELHTIATLTLLDRQFLKGDADGKPVTIAGQLRIAQGSGRLPLVVLQHGSGGYAGNVDVWSRHLNALGIATFALDGFTGRGLAEVNTNQALLARLNFILDLYRALEVVGSHPRIDPRRIALMGFRVEGKPPCTQASSVSMACGIGLVWNPPPMWPSTRIV